MYHYRLLCIIMRIFVEQKIINILSMETYSEIKRTVETNFKGAKSESDMRFYLLCMMALETGARVSDLLLLNWEDISIEHKDVEYLNKKSKKKQIQLLSDNTINSILTYKDVVGESNLRMGLFYNDKKGSVMSRITANRRTQKEFGFNFHELRKEAGKNVANQKGVVYASKYLGHSRVSTTDIYLGVSANTYREQMKDVKI